MKVLYTAIFCLLTLAVTAQGKEMKKAVKNGNYNSAMYEAQFKKLAELDKIKKWCSDNGYVLMYTKNGQISKFGRTKEGVAIALFVTERDYAEIQRKEEKRRQVLAEARQAARRKSNVDAAITLGGTLLAVGAVAKGIFSSGNDSSSSSSSSSSRQYSNSSCKKWTSIHIEVDNELEDKRKFVISGGPSGSSFDEDYTGDTVTINNYVSDCVKGDYTFRYTYNIGQSDETIVSGSFSIDGQSDYYTINVDSRGNKTIRAGY